MLSVPATGHETSEQINSLEHDSERPCQLSKEKPRKTLEITASGQSFLLASLQLKTRILSNVTQTLPSQKPVGATDLVQPLPQPLPLLTLSPRPPLPSTHRSPVSLRVHLLEAGCPFAQRLASISTVTCLPPLPLPHFPLPGSLPPPLTPWMQLSRKPPENCSLANPGPTALGASDHAA